MRLWELGFLETIGASSWGGVSLHRASIQAGRESRVYGSLGSPVVAL